jgi:iron complex outermembrane receptor protein
MNSISRMALAAATTVVAPLGVSSAHAQQNAAAAESSSTSAEIIVTARKRQESVINVPVIMTVIPEKVLERLQTSDVKDISRLVPGITLGHSLLSVGTLVSIRGVGTSAQDPGIDQSVSLNIDGLSLGQGLALSSAFFDMGQVEVLKGPQALFYGKSSPAGVISIRTADPTSEVELIARAGYEFEADEKRAELVVSGPLSDTLKGRVGGVYSTQIGYFTNAANPAANTGGATPLRRETHARNYIVRGTLLWNPSGVFRARLKANLVHDRAINAEAFQLAACPDGLNRVLPPFNIPFIVGDDCKLNRTVGVSYMDPLAFPGITNNGVPYLQNDQRFGTLEFNYNPRSSITFTSVTGYYSLRSSSLVNPGKGAGAGPPLSVGNRFRRHDFTEELRLNTDFSGPVNASLGAFYQRGHVFDRVDLIGNHTLPAPFNSIHSDRSTQIDIKTYSAFGQLRLKLTPQLELAGGARWTDETRRESPFDYLTNSPISVVRPKISAKNIAPEATLTYRPTDDLTLFAAYKRGFKSGSFSIATPPSPGADNAFGDERVKGGEVGLKSRLLDRQLRLDVAAYDYRYSGLQIGIAQPSVNGVPIVRTVNAGAARTYGIDFDASYQPSAVPGLSVRLAVNWNHGRYTTLNNLPCYTGQTVALGCTQALNPLTNRYTAQDLSGSPLARAPKWQSTFGFDYEVPVAHHLKLTITNSNEYSSNYVYTLAKGDPIQDKFQHAFLKADLSIALGSRDERWEVAVIGKNITDKLTSGNCSFNAYSLGTSLPGAITGGTTSGIVGSVEKGCYTEPGRSLWVRLTLRPLAGRR